MGMPITENFRTQLDTYGQRFGQMGAEVRENVEGAFQCALENPLQSGREVLGDLFDGGGLHDEAAEALTRGYQIITGQAGNSDQLPTAGNGNGR